MKLAGKGESSPRFWVGSYAAGGRGAVHLCRLENGAPVLEDSFAGIDCPSYLALGRGGQNLYAVSELEENAFVYAYAVTGGGLKLLNRMPVGGAPCHLAVSRDSSLLAVACYLGGQAALFPLANGGSCWRMATGLSATVATGQTRPGRKKPTCTVPCL